MNAPLPEMPPPTMYVSERLMAKIDPLAPPLPSCRAPPLIVVPPV
jgi:hypothetical protein